MSKMTNFIVTIIVFIFSENHLLSVLHTCSAEGQTSHCPVSLSSLLQRKSWIHQSHQMEKDTGILGIWQRVGEGKTGIWGYLDT